MGHNIGVPDRRDLGILNHPRLRHHLPGKADRLRASLIGRIAAVDVETWLARGRNLLPF